MVEREQRGRRVGAAAAEAPPMGMRFGDAQGGPSACRIAFSARAARTNQDRIRAYVGRPAVRSIRPSSRTVMAMSSQRSMRLEEGLQVQWEAVSAFSGDVREQD
jgi:hypothetical protein